MADAVASQTLFDGERMAIMKFTNISDGTGETKVAKVDPAALTPSAAGGACDAVTITKIHASTHGDRKSTRLNSSHVSESRMPSSA